MERLITIIFLFFSWTQIQGQLLFDGAILPNPGDSIVYKKDIVNVPDNFEPGANQSWDFSSLQSPLLKTSKFPPSVFYKNTDQEGRVFEMTHGDITLLYNRTGDAIEEIGFLLPVGKKSMAVVPVYYDRPIEVNTKSLSFGTRTVKKANFRFELTRQQLPRDVARDMPTHITVFEIIGTKTLIRHADAWGALRLPDEMMKANRVRVSETINVRIQDKKTGKSIPYFDLDMITRTMHHKLKNRWYEFYSEKYPHITAKVLVNDKNVMTTIDFQSHTQPRNAINTNSKKSDFILYPNPTYNIAKVYISQKARGKYSLAVYNIIGKKLWQKSIDVEGDTIIKENFGFLTKGTYLISLLDENGNILRTTRLIIISV